MQITYNASNDLTAQLAAKTARIENSIQYMQYKGLDMEHGSMFLVQKKNYINNYQIGVDLRYYKSYQGFSGSRSGAAIFKAQDKETERFSKVSQVFYHISEIVSQITIIYNDT